MWLLYKSSLVKFCRINMAITYNAWGALYGGLLNYNPKRCNLHQLLASYLIMDVIWERSTLHFQSSLVLVVPLHISPSTYPPVCYSTYPFIFQYCPLIFISPVFLSFLSHSFTDFLVSMNT